MSQFREQMTAIGQAAEQVCDEEELQILGAALLEWPDERAAESIGISVDELRASRPSIHEKIRSAIGAEQLAELSRRRRYTNPGN